MSKFTNLIAIPKGINQGLRGTSNTLMLSLLGSPSDKYTRSCTEPSNPKFLSQVAWGKDVGPFRVSGYKLAVNSLKKVMQDIKQEQPEIYNGLSTAGMLCSRYVRGSRSSISNHSWGTAIDLKINGVLDRRGNDKVQVGLALIAPIFNRHGWFWGAGFPTEDAMHFEVSREKLKQWLKSGKITTGGRIPKEVGVTLGERNNEVKEIQRLLNAFGHSLVVDGLYGAATRAAIISLQAVLGMTPSGIVDAATFTKLKGLI